MYGRKFTLIKDHKPLVYLFERNASIPAMALPRVRRWTLTLSAYNYDIQYKKGSDIPNVDDLSCISLPDLPLFTHTPEELVLMINMLNSESVMNVDVVRKSTRQESALSQVLQWVRWGWPEKDPGGIYSPYFSRRHEISVMEGCLMWR